MGARVKDSTAMSILVQINARFGAGDPIQELIGLQKEFKIFGNNHSLRNSFALLNIAPPPGEERNRWYSYLDQLQKYGSDKSGVSGHDRIVQEIAKNLESSEPLPMRLAVHHAKDSKAVKVAVETPIIFSPQKYLVVSVPVGPGV
ncbi:MAG TPA: hypothetical protein VEH75_02340 [Xanthobacteraceae bacterium]|nr:hypothetical protein [Xanthobacteraceae bacterium]